MRSLCTSMVAATLLVAAALSVPALAQSNNVQGGIGTQTYGPVNVDLLTGGNNGGLGVEYFAPTNSFYVTSRGSVTGGLLSVAPPHSIYQFDTLGNLVNTYQQSPTANVTWGHRDGANDGLNLFFGDEGGLSAYDMSSGTPTYTTAATVITATGPQATTFPIPLPSGVTLIRALAYDPMGNSGDGSFWTANFGSALVEFSRTGTVVNQFAFNGTWSIYGLAIDPVTGNFWASSSPNVGDMVEISRTTGVETGVRIPRAYPGTAQGGVTIAQRPGGPFVELVSLDQGTPDAITGYRLHLYSTVNGTQEVRLASSVNAGVLNSLDKNFTLGSTLLWQYQAPPVTPDYPGLLIVNLLADAIPIGATLGLPEFIVLNNFSSPTQSGFSFTIGDGFNLGGLAAPPLPLGPNSVLAPPGTLVWPVALMPGNRVRMQSLVLEPLSPNMLMATNTIRFIYQ